MILATYLLISVVSAGTFHGIGAATGAHDINPFKKNEVPELIKEDFDKLKDKESSLKTQITYMTEAKKQCRCDAYDKKIKKAIRKLNRYYKRKHKK